MGWLHYFVIPNPPLFVSRSSGEDSGYIRRLLSKLEDGKRKIEYRKLNLVQNLVHFSFYFILNTFETDSRQLNRSQFRFERCDDIFLLLILILLKFSASNLSRNSLERRQILNELNLSRQPSIKRRNATKEKDKPLEDIYKARHSSYRNSGAPPRGREVSSSRP